MLPRPYRDQRVVNERKKKVAEVFRIREAEKEAALIEDKAKHSLQELAEDAGIQPAAE
jgi:hypothetical protein